MANRSICVVMPLYNEEESIRKTVEEWLSELRAHDGLDFELLLIDDGSKDASLAIIQEMAESNKELRVRTGPNKGHGKSCLEGYSYAHAKGFDLVMQLDSDGQCDPKYFGSFLSSMDTGRYDAVYGLRFYRKDGFIRYAVSRILSVIAFVRSGTWVFDPNVPYRLFRTKTLDSMLRKESVINLYNVYLALFHRRYSRMKFIPIVFRDRWGGSPSVKLGGLWRWGVQFWQESSRIDI